MKNFSIIAFIVILFLSCNKNIEDDCKNLVYDSNYISFTTSVDNSKPTRSNEVISSKTIFDKDSGIELKFNTIDGIESEEASKLNKILTRGSVVTESDVNSFGVFCKFTDNFDGSFSSSDLLYNFNPTNKDGNKWLTGKRWNIFKMGHFVAYYPYDSQNPERWYAGNNVRISCPGNLSGIGDSNPRFQQEIGRNDLPNNTDLLYAYVRTNDNTNAVPLHFKHLLAAVKFNIENSTYESFWDIGLIGLYTSAKLSFNRSTGEYSLIEPADKANYGVKQNWHRTQTPNGILKYKGTDKEVVFFCIPQRLPEGAKLFFTMRHSNGLTPNGRQPVINISGLNLEAGKTTIITINERPMLVLERYYLDNYNGGPHSSFYTGRYHNPVREAELDGPGTSTYYTILTADESRVILPAPPMNSYFNNKNANTYIYFNKTASEPVKTFNEDVTTDGIRYYGASDFKYAPNCTYALRFKDTDKESAWKYEYYPATSQTGAYYLISEVYLGQRYHVTLDEISDPAWWDKKQNLGVAINVRFDALSNSNNSYYWCYTNTYTNYQLHFTPEKFEMVKGGECNGSAYLKPYRTR